MRYKFKAIDLNGEEFEDYYIANSKEEVAQMLKSKDYFVLSIEEDNKVNLSSIFINYKVKLTDLIVFCRLFYTMIDAGSNISNSLKVISENTTNKRLRIAIVTVNEDIHKGMSLSDAMSKQNNIFPTLFIELVRAGEISGSLEEIIKRLGDYYDDKNKMRNKLKSALIYPSLLIIVSVAVVTFMFIFVLPIFNDIFGSRQVSLPLPTQILIRLSKIINLYWARIFMLLIILISFIRIYKKTDNGKSILDLFRIKTPYIRVLYLKIATVNLTKTLSILLTAGVPLLKSLEMAGNVVNNIHIKKKLGQVIIKVEEGSPLPDAIKEMRIFSSVVSSMIKIGEETGALDNMLLKISILFDEEVSTSLDKLVKLIEPALMLIVGFVIGFIVISLALPMFEVMYAI